MKMEAIEVEAAAEGNDDVFGDWLVGLALSHPMRARRSMDQRSTAAHLPLVQGIRARTACPYLQARHLQARLIVVEMEMRPQ